MPLYMDRHDVPGATAEDVAAAHARDLEVSAKHGVQFLSYWFDADRGETFCFAKAPDGADLEATHLESHGMIPHEIIAVSEDNVLRFLGGINDPADHTQTESPFRIILFTDLEGSTSLLQEVGEAEFMVLLTEHDLIIRRALVTARGREVKHTGDGIMASFDDVSHALECAVAIQDGFDARTDAGDATAPSSDRNGGRTTCATQRRHIRRSGEPGQPNLRCRRSRPHPGLRHRSRSGCRSRVFVQ